MTTADEDLMAMRSRDIGLDSLISVDIRSWFLKNFGVSVPVLKIMGNDTMADLAALVASQVPPALLPGLGGASEAPKEETAAPAPAPAPAQAIVPPTINIEKDDDASSATGSSSDMGIATGATTPALRDPKEAFAINWKNEITLPKPVMISPQNVPSAKPKVIALTGVSGLLGKALLTALLADASVEKVICLATRRLDERLASGELLKDDRVTYYAGDLEKFRLGLSEKDTLDIFSKVDAIIHNGADTSHLKFYPEIKAANTTSTRELIRYSMARKVPIHYLSTVGVALFGGVQSFHPISASAYTPPTDGSHGYVAAKWASERLLEELNKKEGTNVWIHRPSTIIREGTDATNSAAAIDWMNALVTYMVKTKSVPTLKNLKGALDLVYVKNAVSSILGCVLENKPQGTGASYAHQVGDIVIPLDQLKEYVVKETGDSNIAVLPIEAWSQKAIAAGLNRGIGALIDSMDDPNQPHYPRMLKE